MSRPSQRRGKDTTAKKIAKALGIPYQRALQLKTKHWAKAKALKADNPDLPMKECAVRAVRQALDNTTAL